MHTFKVGDRVRMTGKFLRNTGQLTGPEGLSRWTVTACDCSLCQTGRFVYTDEPNTYRDPDQMPNLHINAGNLEKVRR